MDLTRCRESHIGSASEPDRLLQYFTRALRPIAQRSVRVWYCQQRLDAVLGDVLTALPDCELVYTIDAGGRQMSSNIHPQKVDTSAYWQDLSKRPIAVPLAALGDAGRSGAFLCDAYVSQVTQRACVTVMYGVRFDSALLGFIAVDFDPDAPPFR